MTQRPIASIRLQCDLSGLGSRMNLLVCQFHACKIKKRRYTQAGHRVAPFVTQVPVIKELILRKAA